MEGGGVRLHVGGLGESVGRDDLLKIFSPMGSVDSVEFVRTKGRSFAYIDFSPSSNNSLTKLFSTYNGCVWKGGRLRLEKAKEHYLARLKREWEEESSASDNTIQAPDNPTPSTHLNIFFPRLRKVKAMPLSGTGKHKYSFQRVTVPSSLPMSFCDCEEHSTSLTPRGTENHVHDMEALNAGINEEEVKIMNSVMNNLFQKNNIPNNEQVPKEDTDNEADQDNLIINVVSGGNNMRDSELDILTRKRKSTFNETTASGERDSEGRKGNHIHPSKKRQSSIPEGSGRQQAIREKKKPSEVDLDKSSDEPSRTISGVKSSSDNVSWSQKSSWKALIASGNSSNFSVSSFLPGVGSSKAVQPASPNTEDAELPILEDLKGLDVARPTVKNKIKKTKSKRSTSSIMEENLPVVDDIERNDTTGSNPVGSDHSETLAEPVTETSLEAGPLELVASTEGDQCIGNDELNFEKDEGVAEDLNAEEESLALKDDVGELEAGKGSLKACSKSTGGSSWLQKASWTQLVSDKDTTSFSLTQLYPDSNSDKPEAVREINNGEGQYSNSNQSESKLQQWGAGGFEVVGSTTVTSLEQNRPSLNGNNLSAGPRLGAKRPIRRNVGSEDTCTFMRSSASLKEWAKAKKALSEPRRKKQSEE